MKPPLDILIEVGMNADGKRGIDYYTESVVNAISKIDDRNRYTLFTYFFKDYESKKLRLPNPKRGNFELVVRRAPERLVKPIEWRLGLPVIERCLIPRKNYSVYHMLSGGSLPHLSRMKGIVTFFDLQAETMPGEPEKAPGVGRIADPFTCDVARRADFLVATGTKTKENLMKYYGIPEEKIRVIHTGVDLDTFHQVDDPKTREAVRKKYGLPSRYLMLIGPYVPAWRTNAEFVLRAFALLKKENATSNCKLLFAGAKNDHLNRLFALGRSLGLDGDMLATGFIDREDLRTVYALSDAVVHPTSVEGFGYGMEVFASGAPFITSDVPGVVEAVADCALTVPPREVAPLAEAMRDIIRDPDLRDELRRKGLARAPRYSYDKVAGQMVALYEYAASRP